MQTVKCFNTNKFHIVRNEDSNRTICGKKIKKELVGGWGARRERKRTPKSLCGECEAIQRNWEG